MALTTSATSQRLDSVSPPGADAAVVAQDRDTSSVRGQEAEWAKGRAELLEVLLHKAFKASEVSYTFLEVLP